ncbi:tyrosine-type recombinase/integrase [Longibacter salinarum]|uniref:tyrosine-type recombinase/integrase n=1 Tax=Longibacter salinarum TaxID=1850348 RepID=UPI001FE7426D|nr:tyrosine-type recombinase/integrase [Longibacter salinarum]
MPPSPDSSSRSHSDNDRPGKGHSDHNRQADIRRVAKILRDGGYTYDRSKHLIAEPRKEVSLTPSKRKKGSVDRLTGEEIDRLLTAAYEKSARQGLMLRTLLETGMRVSFFAKLTAEQIAFREKEIRVRGRGGKARDIPILQSLVNELRLHLGNRRTGYVFPSPRGGHYSSRRIQQIVKERAKDAEITKRFYPHLLRHTVAKRLADEGMPENLLQKFLGHENAQTTQVYYEPSRAQVKQAFEDAMD